MEKSFNAIQTIRVLNKLHHKIDIWVLTTLPNGSYYQSRWLKGLAVNNPYIKPSFFTQDAFRFNFNEAYDWLYIRDIFGVDRKLIYKPDMEKDEFYINIPGKVLEQLIHGEVESPIIPIIIQPTRPITELGIEVRLLNNKLYDLINTPNLLEFLIDYYLKGYTVLNGVIGPNYDPSENLTAITLAKLLKKD